MQKKIFRTGIAMIVLCVLSSFIGLQLQQFELVNSPKNAKMTEVMTGHDTIRYNVKDGCLSPEGKNEKINVLFLLW